MTVTATTFYIQSTDHRLKTDEQIISRCLPRKLNACKRRFRARWASNSFRASEAKEIKNKLCYVRPTTVDCTRKVLHLHKLPLHTVKGLQKLLAKFGERQVRYTGEFRVCKSTFVCDFRSMVFIRFSSVVCAIQSPNNKPAPAALIGGAEFVSTCALSIGNLKG